MSKASTGWEAPKPTLGWERIGDKFYRKTELYRDVFDPELELENYSVTGAPFSGAVGKHPTQLLTSRADQRQHCAGIIARHTPSEARSLPNRPSTFTAVLGS